MATPPPVPLRNLPSIIKKDGVPLQPTSKKGHNNSLQSSNQNIRNSQLLSGSHQDDSKHWLNVSSVMTVPCKQPAASSQQYSLIHLPNDKSRQLIQNRIFIPTAKEFNYPATPKKENNLPQNKQIKTTQPTLSQQNRGNKLTLTPNVTGEVNLLTKHKPKGINAYTNDNLIISKYINKPTTVQNIAPKTNISLSNIQKPEVFNIYPNKSVARKKFPPPPLGPPPAIPSKVGSSNISSGSLSSCANSSVRTNDKSIVKPMLNQNIKISNNLSSSLSQRCTSHSLVSTSTSKKLPEHQDINICNDIFNKTSSQGSTTKRADLSLFPFPSVSSRILYNEKLKSAGNNQQNNFAVPQKVNEVLESDKEGKSNAVAITKSFSTPASLQTIVRFHNGSNMSLHHRIIRDMRRPSSHYINHIRLKFRLAQIIVNAIALLAIGGGLAAYFKAYPTTVQLITSNGTTNTTIISVESGINPAPGICLPVIVSFCQYHQIPYNYTVFPNYMGHFGQRDAQQELEVYDAVVDVRCYELAALFLCSVFVPKCGPAGQVVRPCRSLCYETKRRCGFFLDVFGLALPEYLNCSLFPESADPNVCVGHNEVKEVQLRAQKPVCPSGFLCDIKRCLPKEWQCDGHVDCKDLSDELNCVHCNKGMIHCGSKRCMAQENMCDGKVDCPYAQDERNCLRLSERNGDEGSGQLEVFRPEHQQWIPACVTHWHQESLADHLCSMLGYAAANKSRVSLFNTNMTLFIKNHHSKWNIQKNNKNRKNLLKEFGSCQGTAYPTVDLICTNYVCGKIRKTYAESSALRIIGGVTSKPGDWPFLAALLGGPEEVFYCAGVLIADQWVLTASHCVGNHSDVSDWTIQLGVTRRYSHPYYGQKVKVRRVLPHPLYNLGMPHDNDIALFQLASPVTYHEHLLPVCLPPADKELLPGTICTVIGWGKKEDKERSEYEPAINEIEVPVLHRELCNTWLENRDLNVTEGMICAGYKEGGKDACQGDSGGPLLCRFESDVDRWFVAGIVSWGIKCAHPHLPGVYAYVPKYISWIKQQISLYSN